MLAPARPRRRSTRPSWPLVLPAPAKTWPAGSPALKACNCRSAGTWSRFHANRARTFRHNSSQWHGAAAVNCGVTSRRFCARMATAATRSARLSLLADSKFIFDPFSSAAVSSIRSSIPIRFGLPERTSREHMRRIGRRRQMQIGPVDLAEVGEAEETERARHFVLHELLHGHNSGLPGGREPMALHAAKPDQVGAKR